MTILDAMRDPRLFGPWFGGASWNSWLVCIAALFGIPLPAGGLELFQECTGRNEPPARQVREGWLIVGRRGGKSMAMALVAVFCAVYRTYRLKPGEVGTVMLLASDRATARVLFRYIEAIFDNVSGLKEKVKDRTKESLTLYSNIEIAVQTASYRSVRGRTVVVAICDEAAFWHSDDSANPDSEILAAIRPAMVTIADALLLVISSPHARRGEVWKAYEHHWGRDSDDILVWKAPTWVMNPELPRAHPDIQRAYDDDASVADAEFGANFRSDCERPLSAEALAAVTVLNRNELPKTTWAYTAFIDASGGSSDSMTLAIAHRNGSKVTLDLTRERKAPFDPDSVVREFAAEIRRYGLSRVRADRYAAEWPRAAFCKLGIGYHASDRTKSELYAEFIPLVNSRRVELLDDPRMLQQFERLERRVSPGGREIIDHPRGGRDDVANAVAGAAYYAVKPTPVLFAEAFIPQFL